MEAPPLLCKIVEQMREIACFTVLMCGSSHLEQLIDSSLSVELHRKTTYKLNANHKTSRKQCFNLWVLDWALCLV